MPLPDWPRAHGQPLFAAIIRSCPEDFDVTEELGFELSGDGEHDFLFIEKVGVNTEWLARQLASFAAVPSKDVGYSGLKDRHAVTRQWFSVPRWNQPDWSGLQVDGVRLLELGRNARKLRRGAHQANRFRIVLRNLQKGSEPFQKGSDPFAERLRGIREHGVPNYFGEQRFGRGGGNVALADQWAMGRRLPRHKRSLAISTARSYLFNQLLAARVADNSWDTFVAGDAANLDGTGSVFTVDELDDDLRKRCRELDIHPTAWLWGDGLDAQYAPPGHDNWLQALAKARVSPARRSLRLRVLDLQWQVDEDSLTLNFGLTRGAYATSVIRELAFVTEFSDLKSSDETHHESP